MSTAELPHSLALHIKNEAGYPSSPTAPVASPPRQGRAADRKIDGMTIMFRDISCTLRAKEKNKVCKGNQAKGKCDVCGRLGKGERGAWQDGHTDRLVEPA